MTRTGVPKPLTSGARIEWLHIIPGRPPYVRRGTVVDSAPLPSPVRWGLRWEPSGVIRALWVQPDEAEESDPYSIIVIGKTSRYMQVMDVWVPKHTLFSAYGEGSPLTPVMDRALRLMDRDRVARNPAE